MLINQSSNIFVLTGFVFFVLNYVIILYAIKVNFKFFYIVSCHIVRSLVWYFSDCPSCKYTVSNENTNSKIKYSAY